MSKTEKVLGFGVLIAIVIAVGAFLQSAGGVSVGVVSPNDLTSTNFTQITASDGLAVGTSQQFQVSSAGVVSSSGALGTTAGSLSVTGTGTSTVAVTTTSTTKGVCFNLIATSSATAINMTFAASTTAASTVGIAPILRYGVCP